MDIGTSIKAIRKQKKMTQKYLASKCDITAHALCNIEKGVTFPSKATISKICSALQIPVSYLLLFCITDSDVPEDKRLLFHSLCDPLKDELIKDIK
mgnify:CR=1 FL=1